MGGLTIRGATPADREALVAGFGGLNAFEDRIAESGGHRLVAERDGAVLGHLFLVFDRQPAYVREDRRDHASVSELFVHPGARGGGVGSALLAEAERLVLARGLDRLMIGVLAGNDGAEALYRRQGFAPNTTEMLKTLR
jgi:GNAT superfamily N-acetyltransferase